MERKPRPKLGPFCPDPLRSPLRAYLQGRVRKGLPPDHKGRVNVEGRRPRTGFVLHKRKCGPAVRLRRSHSSLDASGLPTAGVSERSAGVCERSAGVEIRWQVRARDPSGAPARPRGLPPVPLVTGFSLGGAGGQVSLAPTPSLTLPGSNPCARRATQGSG